MDEDARIGADPEAADDLAPLLHLAGRRPRLPEEAVAPIRAAAREVFRRQARRTAIRRRLGWTLASASAAVLLVVAGLTLHRPAVPGPGSPVATFEMRTGEVAVAGTVDSGTLFAGATVTTGQGGHAAVRLPAGASVRIDAGSSVRFDSPRLVKLERGALYVDSGAAPGGGIEVATDLGSVRDVGTRFEVRLLDGALRVRVREGMVLAGRAGEAHQARAGGELVLQADGRFSSAATPVYGADWDWVQHAGRAMAIEGATLADFLDWVSGETGLRWRLAEPQTARPPKDITLHGSIEGLTAEEALAVVLPGCGYRHRVDGDQLWLEPN